MIWKDYLLTTVSRKSVARSMNSTRFLHFADRHTKEYAPNSKPSIASAGKLGGSAAIDLQSAASSFSKFLITLLFTEFSKIILARPSIAPSRSPIFLKSFQSDLPDQKLPDFVLHNSCSQCH